MLFKSSPGTSISIRTDIELAPAYINSTSKGAYIDQNILVSAGERELASGLRHVQDPLVVRSQSAKVFKTHPLTTTYIRMRKI
jgi:hypothetical protein